jgi:hypothetical protein
MTTATITTSPIPEGLEFILSHIESPIFSGDINPSYFSLWPKTISTARTEGAQIRVNSPNEAISEFYKARFLDCKINAYPNYTDDFRKGIQDCTSYGGRGIVPNFLFIDLDKGAFNGNLYLLSKALMKTLDNINEKFHGIFKPTILWSGNGYHIYLPVQLSGLIWCLGHSDVFSKLSREPDRKFIQWAEQYLSDGKADPCHSKGLSFKNCMLRVPGSINSKNGSQVRIIQRWDGQRPYINWILRDFRRYLIQKKIKPEKKRMTRVYSTNWNKRMSTAAW